MAERLILHIRFLGFFKKLEETGDLSSKTASKSFRKLAETLEIHTKLLSDYLQSKRYITFLQAYLFCNNYEISLESMFKEMPNYLEKVIEEGGFNIVSDQNVVGGMSISIGLINRYELTGCC